MDICDRVIFHCDMNSAYANIASLEFPSIREKPVAVCGDPERRHGIILAANQKAKATGIKTGNAVWEAQQMCSDIELVGIGDLGFDRIMRVSDNFFAILRQYTDLIEMEGLDGGTMDMSGSIRLYGEPKKVANDIRERIKRQLGITVSVGVSYNRIFAKLASEIKKPDAVSVIPFRGWKQIVWPMPVGDLYYIGRATTGKLTACGVTTIGALARTAPEILEKKFGKVGMMLWRYANGLDDAPVALWGTRAEEKTIGNTTTAPRDLKTKDDILLTTTMLCESVSERLRNAKYFARGLQVWLRFSDLSGFQRQKQLTFPSRTSKLLCKESMGLMLKNWNGEPLRGLGVRAINLIEDDYYQMNLFPEMAADQRQEILETVLQDIRRRMGHFSLYRANALTDPDLIDLDIRDEYSPHSIAFRRYPRGA